MRDIKMRAYFFGNMYLSSIQQGIQAAHVLGEMFIKYTQPDDMETEMLHEWAKNHKTMILLNGGYSESIRDLYEFLKSSENPYPFADFHEGQDALDGALTSVGIVLPEKIYGFDLVDVTSALGFLAADGFYSKTVTDKKTGYVNTYEYTKWELELIQRIGQFGLAR
jgi:hypothetical protein